MGFQNETTVQGEGQGEVPLPREDVPVAGVVVQTYDGTQAHQVVVVSEQKEDYFPACLGTALFGCFGIVGTLVCCPSNWGKLGSSAGFAWFNLWRALLFTVALILIGTGAVSLTKDVYPDEISQHKCADIKGIWNATEGACFGACPDGYSLHNATELTLPHLEGTQWEQWCEESVDVRFYTFNLILALILFAVAAYFVRHYSKQVSADTYETV